MDLLSDEYCDLEVFMCFPENFSEVREFTSSPPAAPGLIRPVAVRLQPPFPWDCEDGQQLIGKKPMKTSAFVPFEKTIPWEEAGDKQAVGIPRCRLDASSNDSGIDNQSIAEAFKCPIQCISSSSKAALSVDQQLAAALSEMESLRIDLQTTKLHAKGLLQRNTKLTNKLSKHKAENAALKRRLEALVTERRHLMDIAQAQFAKTQLQQKNDRVDGGKRVLCPDKVSLACSDNGSIDSKKVCEVHHVTPGIHTSDTVCSFDKESQSSSCEKKNKKRRSVFRRLRNAFRKMTNPK